MVEASQATRDDELKIFAWDYEEAWAAMMIPAAVLQHTIMSDMSRVTRGRAGTCCSDYTTRNRCAAAATQ